MQGKAKTPTRSFPFRKYLIFIRTRLMIMIRALFFLALCSVSLRAAAQDIDSTSKGSFFSFREREELNIDELLDAVAAAPLPGSNGSATPVSPTQALATLRRLTRDSLPKGVSSQPATLRSAAAMSLGQSLGLSQAFLLEAERIRPGEPQTRISMAGLLIVQGYPREAMSLLGPTPPPDSMKLNGRRSVAAAWNLARGVAHLAAREPQKALPFLEKAVQQDGFLTEASRSLAKAQLMLGNREGARQTLKSGAWRQRGQARWSSDGKRGVMPYHKTYKLNNGTMRSMRDIEAPLTAKDYLLFRRSWDERQRNISEKQMAATQQLMEASQEVVSVMMVPKTAAQQKAYLTGAENRAAADALAPVTNMMGISPLNTQWEPATRAGFNYLSTKIKYAEDIEDIALHDLALSSRQNAMITQMLIYMDVVPGFNEDIVKETLAMTLPDDPEQRCRKLIAYTEGKLPTAYKIITPLDQSVREWYGTSWKISSAISKHIPYGPLFKQTEATLESMTWQAETFRLSNWMVAYALLPDLEGCEQYMGPVVPKPPKTEAEKKLQACNDFTSGMSFKFKIPKAGQGTLLEMGLSCEKVSFKGDIWNSGILSAKVGVEYAPGKGTNGELTALLGVAADIPGGFGVEVDGFYTYDVGKGECTDWGAKISAESNINVKPVSGVDTDMVTDLNFEQGGNIYHQENGKGKVNDVIIYVATGLQM